jgi:hypothetical protein
MAIERAARLSIPNDPAQIRRSQDAAVFGLRSTLSY